MHQNKIFTKYVKNKKKNENLFLSFICSKMIITAFSIFRAGPDVNFGYGRETNHLSKITVLLSALK